MNNNTSHMDDNFFPHEYIPGISDGGQVNGSMGHIPNYVNTEGQANGQNVQEEIRIYDARIHHLETELDEANRRIHELQNLHQRAIQEISRIRAQNIHMARDFARIVRHTRDRTLRGIHRAHYLMIRVNQLAGRWINRQLRDLMETGASRAADNP